ncbi:MAG: hypothetical protein CL694_05610 [Chloroflexi bacterium]|nr:hypothetical protein [Chloroflexota bacterium]MDP6421936.1 DUF167 domain-containing protein [SAR202 cluster bacterium]MQG59353.1 DUF167 domain-containing protein [SAR202 cluster bacterium]HAL49314.1 hypothetical protein [Dehalococcoidia bacterium]
MAELQVRVTPRAKRNAIELDDDGRIRVRVTAVPERGKANAAVVALIAKTLGLSKRSIAVVRGHTSRDKLIAVDGMDRDEVLERLIG